MSSFGSVEVRPCGCIAIINSMDYFARYSLVQVCSLHNFADWFRIILILLTLVNVDIQAIVYVHFRLVGSPNWEVLYYSSLSSWSILIFYLQLSQLQTHNMCGLLVIMKCWFLIHACYRSYISQTLGSRISDVIMLLSRSCSSDKMINMYVYYI